MRRAEESFFCRTARISKTRAARCGRARSHEVTTRISDRRKAFAGARAAVPGAAALYMARQTCSTWALTAFALANERAREARACPPLRGEQHAARPRASGVACGSAARSKHSETRRRSSLALVMLRKKKQWSATPLMPNVLLLEPTAARARVGLGSGALLSLYLSRRCSAARASRPASALRSRRHPEPLTRPRSPCMHARPSPRPGSCHSSATEKRPTRTAWRAVHVRTGGARTGRARRRAGPGRT